MVFLSVWKKLTHAEKQLVDVAPGAAVRGRTEGGVLTLEILAGNLRSKDISNDLAGTITSLTNVHIPIFWSMLRV